MQIHEVFQPVYRFLGWAPLIVSVLLAAAAGQVRGAGGPGVPGSPPLAGQVLRHSDVVFMYQADTKTYQEYGATVLAWGGKPSSASDKGVKVFGSVGMVTEFSRYYERFPGTYEQGLCRDVRGQPVKVPWLTDHQHKGAPYWWCCTQQPLFRQYLSERVIETVKAGADGVHIDDHMGTAGGLWLGVCFCDRCVDGFRAYVATLPAAERQDLGILDANQFNYRDVVSQWLKADPAGQRKVPQHPLWTRWTIYQCRAAAAFMQQLRDLAARTAGHPMPIGANAGLLWPRHLADYQSLDLFSAETDHHAARDQFCDLPIFAYRMADAVDRPYASTASGGDWAYIQEHQLPGLVQGWIALSYAAGHCLMAPNKQWCYTPQKGTHWYQGPAEKFAPLYQFVRSNARLLDGFQTFADVGVVLPHRAFLKNPSYWFDLCQQFNDKNISYRLLLAGDEIVDHSLTARDLNSSAVLLVPERAELLPADRQLLEEQTRLRPACVTVAEALAASKPAVQLQGNQAVRVLPRVKTGAAAIHLLNYSYDRSRDDVRQLQAVVLKVNFRALGISTEPACAWTDLKGTSTLPVTDGSVQVPALGLWGILSFGAIP